MPVTCRSFLCTVTKNIMDFILLIALTDNVFSNTRNYSKETSACAEGNAKNVTDFSYETFEEMFTNEVEDDYSIPEEYLEERENDLFEAPLFDGRAGMTARTRLPAKSFDIWAEVSAVCGQGTLVSSMGKRDHLWLGFVGDKAVLRWDAGSGPLELRTGKVKTDRRSIISARRYKKDAVLKYGSATVRGSAPGRMSSLDVPPLIHVGASPENVTRKPGVPNLIGFIGCVHRLRVSGRDVIPPARHVAVTSHGIRACTPHNIARLVCP